MFCLFLGSFCSTQNDSGSGHRGKMAIFIYLVIYVSMYYLFIFNTGFSVQLLIQNPKGWHQVCSIQKSGVGGIIRSSLGSLGMKKILVQSEAGPSFRAEFMTYLTNRYWLIARVWSLYKKHSVPEDGHVQLLRPGEVQRDIGCSVQAFSPPRSPQNPTWRESRDFRYLKSWVYDRKPLIHTQKWQKFRWF